MKPIDVRETAPCDSWLQDKWGCLIANWRLDVSFSCVCPVIDHEFRHSIVKVAVDRNTHNFITLFKSLGRCSTRVLVGETVNQMNKSNKSNQIKLNVRFEERGKLEYPEKNLSEQSREPTNSVHIWRLVRESNPGHERSHHCANPDPQIHILIFRKARPSFFRVLRRMTLVYNVTIFFKIWEIRHDKWLSNK